MSFDELCKQDDGLLSLYQEALIVSGKLGRIVGFPPKPPKPDFCADVWWYGAEGATGDIGGYTQLLYISRSNPLVAEQFELCSRSIRGALIACQHQGPCYGNFPLEILPCATCGSTEVGRDVKDSPQMKAWTCSCGTRRESLKRPRRTGFGGLSDMLRHAAGTGPEPKMIDASTSVPNDTGEPAFIVQSTEAACRLRLDLKYRERLEAGEITRWYASNSVYVCDAKARKLLLSTKLTKEALVGALSWKPVVLTFKDEALERKLATVCAQVMTIEPDKNGGFDLDRVHQIVKEIAPAMNLDVPDMPAEVFDGWLGELCRKHMAGFPIAYAWPALLTAASVLVPNLPGNVRTNLYTGLVGGVGTGKTSAFERAFWLLNLVSPALLNLKSGSGEGMAEFIGDVNGAKRLVFVNELAHLLAKVNYQGSTFEQFLNDAYYQNVQNLTVARGKRIVFNACISLAGGLPEDKYDELFGVGTIGGFHDRAMFGICPTKVEPYEWKPFEGDSPIANELPPQQEAVEDNPFSETPVGKRPQVITVDAAVWSEKKRWQKEYGIGGRAAEAGIRAAIIAAAFDCRGTLRVEELGPALAFARYQEFVHKRYAPNPGKTNEGICAHKILSYLKQNAPAPECKWVNRRGVILSTNCHDFGPGVAIRACLGLESIGEIEQVKSGKQNLIRLNPDRY
ncbi:MAG: hypothetical protein WBX03_15450 [Terriglobales bacterium]